MMPRLRTLPTRLQSLQSRVVIAEAGSWRVGKTSSAARGYGYDWQKLRERHLAAHPHCVFCLRDLGMLDMSPAEVVLACAERGVAEPLGNIGDHIVPHQGNDMLRLDPNNVQTLCKPHHDGEKARLERGPQRTL
ncbi:HNH endonuclease [bacterium M00.F.Ca.ET.228.01.1.1]|nr:HNH endonuclease [bacterium M00.F.Ca.ET.228.01.1.1]TGS00901.1 HNH endonuclease [bacterium M00.F.Ca.ET.191.01.1.1]TGU05286.1 HNH endonuclease [bacterium M00.F.Ca.ET.155.01.1.1]